MSQVRRTRLNPTQLNSMDISGNKCVNKINLFSFFLRRIVMIYILIIQYLCPYNLYNKCFGLSNLTSKIKEKKFSHASVFTPVQLCTGRHLVFQETPLTFTPSTENEGSDTGIQIFKFFQSFGVLTLRKCYLQTYYGVG